MYISLYALNIENREKTSPYQHNFYIIMLLKSPFFFDAKKLTFVITMVFRFCLGLYLLFFTNVFYNLKNVWKFTNQFPDLRQQICNFLHKTITFCQQARSLHKNINLSQQNYQVSVSKSQLFTYLLTFNKEIPTEEPISLFSAYQKIKV